MKGQVGDLEADLDAVQASYAWDVKKLNAYMKE